MKKIKTINKLLSSLTLLSPLSGVGFNSQCQSNQITTIKNNNSLGNYFVKNIPPVQMGDIWVTVDDSDPTIITGYSSGSGRLQILSDITEISNNSFQWNNNIQLLDLSNATSLTTFGTGAFDNCWNLSGDLVIPSSVTSIEGYAFYTTKITSLDLSQATSLTTIGNNAFKNCLNLSGDITIPSNVTSIGNEAFEATKITSLNLSNATSLTTIGYSAFITCPNLTGDLVISASVTSIGNRAFSNTNITSIKIDPSNKNFSFVTNLGPNAKVLVSGSDGIWKDDSMSAGSLASGDIVIPSNISTISIDAFYGSNITSLDLSNATSLTSIRDDAFHNCLKLNGNLTIPSKVTNILGGAFYACKADNLYFISETPPEFNGNWGPILNGKVYVPSETAKEAYLGAPNFGFTEDQIEIGLPPEPTPEKSYIPLIFALLIALGIPIVLAVAFIIWYATRKKKTTVKI